MTELDATAREQFLRTYFRPAPSKPRLGASIGVLALGVFLSLSGLSLLSASDDGFGCAGLLMAPGIILTSSASLLILVKHLNYRQHLHTPVSEQEEQRVRELLHESMQRIAEYSQRVLGIAEDQLVAEPLRITGPVLWWIPGIEPEDLTWLRGTDGTIIFGVYNVAILALTKQRLTFFSCDYNFVKDSILNERSQEYLYKNIVSVSIERAPSSYELPTGHSLTETRYFRISVASGEPIQVVIDAPLIQQMTGVEALPDSGAEMAVRAIRAKLRK